MDRRALPEPEAGTGAERIGPRSEVEARLVAIWRSVLKRDDVGVTDDFFDIGGDSILSLQIVARARRDGLHLTPRQVFERPTIERLAQVALRETAAGLEEVLAAQALTPIQASFFARHPDAPGHWNQAVLLRAQGDVDVAALERALSALVARHDALRLRFARDEAGAWQQRVVAWEPGRLLVVDDLRAASDWIAQLSTRGTELQASLDLSQGPLLAASLFRVPGGENRLLLAIHHLAVDGVSWRVLLEDLQEGYGQALSDHAVVLPPVATPWSAWVQRLSEHGGTAGVQSQLGWWREALSDASGALPVEGDGDRSLEASATETQTWDEDETRRLLRVAPRAYRLGVDEVLLTALSQTLGAWSGGDGILVDLEGHGREALSEMLGVDVSRTVGWFTTRHPVWLATAEDAGAALRGVKERLRSVPGKGSGWGLLQRYGDAAVRDELKVLPQPGVSFNYLGQFDQSLDQGGPFGFASESGGRSMTGASPLAHVLDLNGLVGAGRLRLSWRYSPGVLSAATVAKLMAAFEARLQVLVEHCESAAPRATRSDYPRSGLDEAGLARLGVSVETVEDVYAATPLQQGLLFHSLLRPGEGLYVNQLRLRLEGTLDVAALRAAWQSAVDRHAILRTRFAWSEGGEARQIVLRRAELPWTETDWRSEADYESRLATWRREDVRQGFELDTAPLLRVALFQRPDGGHDLVWTNHHVLTDGWSSARLLGEVVREYAARVGGETPAIVTPAPYRDYVSWLSHQGNGEDWWRTKLGAVEEPVGLLESLGRPSAVEAGPQEQRVDLGEELTARLKEASRVGRVTLNTLMQGAWALLLSRYGGRGSVRFGITVSGRPAELAGVEGMVGLFINSLPLWLDVPGEARVGAWLRGLQAHNVELRQYEHVGLGDVQRWAGRSGEALFDTLLVFENYPVERELGAVPTDLRVVTTEAVERTHYPLTLSVMPDATMRLRWAWDGERLDRATVERLSQHYIRMLGALAEGLEKPVGAISLGEAAPSVRSLTAYAFTPVTAQIAAQAMARPDAGAVSCEGERLSYGALEAWSNRIGRRLKTLGVGRDVRVGVCLERSVGMVAGLLGVLKAGGAYVPLDPSYPEARLRHMVQDAGVGCVVTDAASAQRLGAVLKGCALVVVSEVDAESAAGWNEAIAADQLAYVIYTSGSTGRPKGVAISHEALDRLLASMGDCPALVARDVWLSVTSLSFDISALEIYLPLVTGARVEIARPEAIADGAKLAGLIKRSGATVLQATPMGWRLLLEADWAAGRLKALCGGEALPPDLAVALLSRGVELWNMYGPTETTIWSSLARITAGDAITVGAAIHDTQITVRDAVGQIAPPGGVGELCIGGTNLARGYLGRPGLTAERFVPDPDGQGGRLYRTGDLGRRRDDASIEVLGRLDQQVKLNGFRIELEEIEATVRACDGVRDAAVALSGTGDTRRLVAYVVGEADGRAVKAALARRLPHYMVPALIVTLDALPRTLNGKLDRKALPASEVQTAYMAPRTPTEEVLSLVCTEVLGVARVGVRDNFFELGGNSLLAVRAVSRLSDRLGQPVELGELFRHPTIEDLASVLAAPGRTTTAANVGLMKGWLDELAGDA
ncbi:non-ribosomal peptide synthetase [Reyranella sp. CPCC 100927]|uniref:non-ribosomal peptide synthetase n=1 Tax=Reyranella sp. CPCC 100927 TaxID=2599616 RepID=UPI001C499450|nr:non-ribosomal peptide synthetase [Reyranella sp. CPCC 100927]